MADPTQDNPAGDLGTGFAASQIGGAISDGISNILTGVGNSIAIGTGGYPYGYDGYYPYGYVVTSPQPQVGGNQRISTTAGMSGTTLLLVLLVIWWFLRKA